ncbi:hypothetical protein [Streptomyces violaceusniger]|uniref:Uncharacterized protein n=1 Tax=Streptomyces violaceusniger (strain Tu 4113) TaxID=653045 RepID=G2PHV8_STRV4|nr:hypothetical protein [Streptomyces violaceusniger]AEM88909.1 hypothetical protein Strvi_0134 [Streptomyces violaceusniger Tu 4113]
MTQQYATRSRLSVRAREAVRQLPLIAGEPGGGFCPEYYSPVDTVNGRYHCHNCGHSGGAP